MDAWAEQMGWHISPEMAGGILHLAADWVVESTYPIQATGSELPPGEGITTSWVMAPLEHGSPMAMGFRAIDAIAPRLVEPTLAQANFQQARALILAQQFDQDILGDLGNAWNTFVQSGQIWALIIGLVLGYLIRGLTVY